MLLSGLAFVVFVLNLTQKLFQENQTLILSSVQSNWAPQPCLISPPSFGLFLQTPNLAELKTSYKMCKTESKY